MSPGSPMTSGSLATVTEKNDTATCICGSQAYFVSGWVNIMRLAINRRSPSRLTICGHFGAVNLGDLDSRPMPSPNPAVDKNDHVQARHVGPQIFHSHNLEFCKAEDGVTAVASRNELPLARQVPSEGEQWCPCMKGGRHHDSSHWGACHCSALASSHRPGRGPSPPASFTRAKDWDISIEN